jgi:Spy/CpxP family protein refolding chaperone
MKPLKFVFAILSFLMAFSVFSQENQTTIRRTPEQEAIKQTEKLQQELNLSSEQAKQLYEINLKYARERQISNKRSEAVERMKTKNAEIQQVLNPEQNYKLQSKRYERTTIESGNLIQNRPVNPSFKPNQETQTNQVVRVQPTDRPTRSSFRPSTPTSQRGTQTPQAVRRSTTTTQPNQSNQPPRSNPSAVRSSSAQSPTSTYAPQRTETPPSQNRR